MRFRIYRISENRNPKPDALSRELQKSEESMTLGLTAIILFIVEYHGELKVNIWDYIGTKMPQKG